MNQVHLKHLTLLLRTGKLDCHVNTGFKSICPKHSVYFPQELGLFAENAYVLVGNSISSYRQTSFRILPELGTSYSGRFTTQFRVISRRLN